MLGTGGQWLKWLNVGPSGILGIYKDLYRRYRVLLSVPIVVEKSS